MMIRFTRDTIVSGVYYRAGDVASLADGAAFVLAGVAVSVVTPKPEPAPEPTPEPDADEPKAEPESEVIDEQPVRNSKRRNPRRAADTE